MSGGYFAYNQYRVEDIADEIHRVIENNDDDTLDSRGCQRGRGYSQETIARFREARAALMRAAAMVHRIDWLLSGDDSEESFHRRWNEESLSR